MTQYLVTWTVDLLVAAPCSDHKPDPYTGKLPNITCAVGHQQKITENKQRYFDTQEAAEKFIDEAPIEIKRTIKLFVEEKQ